jgi:hypothetical protein
MMVILPPLAQEIPQWSRSRQKAAVKLVEFDAQTWHALNLLSRESRRTFQQSG